GKPVGESLGPDGVADLRLLLEDAAGDRGADSAVVEVVLGVVALSAGQLIGGLGLVSFFLTPAILHHLVHLRELHDLVLGLPQPTGDPDHFLHGGSGLRAARTCGFVLDLLDQGLGLAQGGLGLTALFGAVAVLQFFVFRLGLIGLGAGASVFVLVLG